MDYRAKRFNKESFTIYANEVINAYRSLEKTYRVIISVARSMNGKVLNKRFWDAVNSELDGVARVSWSDTYKLGYHTMNIYLDKRSVQINSSTEYFDRELNCSYVHDVEEAFLTEGRIDIEKVGSVCDSNIEHIAGYIERWEDAMTNYDSYQNQLKEAMKELGEKMKAINTLFKPSTISSYDWEHC